MKGNTKLMTVTAFAMISLLAMPILTLNLQVKAQQAQNQTSPLSQVQNKLGANVIVILDSHIRDIPFVEVAKQIVNRKSCKQIIFTTTLPNIDLTCIDNNNSAILLKPF